MLASGKHLFQLEPFLRPLLTLAHSPQPTIGAFGRFASNGWLHEPGCQQQRGQCFGAMLIVHALRPVAVGIISSCADEEQPQFCN